MKYLRFLFALAALVTFTSAALAQNDVYLHPTQPSQGQPQFTGETQLVYFIADSTSGGVDGGLLDGGQNLNSHLKFKQGASFDLTWSQSKAQGLLKGRTTSYNSAKFTTKDARKKGLSALGKSDEPKESDPDACNPAYIAASVYTFSIEKSEDGNSDSRWGSQRSRSEKYVDVRFTVLITCFRFDGKGEAVVVRASACRSFLLGKEVNVSDDGRPIFLNFRRSGLDYSSQQSSHVSHEKSVTTMFGDLEEEVFDSASSQLIQQLPN